MFTFAAFRQLFEGIGACGFTQTETRNGGVEVHGDQRFCDQIGEALDDILRREIGIRCNPRRRFKIESTGKNADPAEQQLLVLAQQTVAPVEDCPNGLVPRHRPAMSRSQQLQAVVEMCGKPPNPEHLNAGRRELDCERHAIEPAADLDNERGVGIAQREIVDHRRDPLQEQLHSGE